MIEVRIELYGAFRQYGDGDVVLPLEAGAGVPELRRELARALEARRPGTQVGSLLESSVFADEIRVLDEASRFENDSKLAILPPVCGG